MTRPFFAVIAKALLILCVALIGAVVGAAIIFFAVVILGELTGSDNQQGAIAMGAAGFIPFGAIVGGVLGTWLIGRNIRLVSSKTAMVVGFGLPSLAAALVGGWFVLEELTDGAPYPANAEPIVLIEWRLPKTVRHDWVDGIFRFRMRSSYRNWTLSTQWQDPRARDEDGHTIIRMRAFIRWRVDGRKFEFWLNPAIFGRDDIDVPRHDKLVLDLGIARDPEPTADYGPWQQVESVPGYAFRTRVVMP